MPESEPIVFCKGALGILCAFLCTDEHNLSLSVTSVITKIQLNVTLWINKKDWLRLTNKMQTLFTVVQFPKKILQQVNQIFLSWQKSANIPVWLSLSNDVLVVLKLSALPEVKEDLTTIIKTATNCCY